MDIKTHHERDLVRLLKLGDEAAMKEIFRLYYPRLHYFSSKITGDRRN